MHEVQFMRKTGKIFFVFRFLKLCENGYWVDNTTIELHPLDAGTDNGFTFTAPDWPTEPQGVIYRVTSGYPAHQAGSFFYPQLKKLPPIAAVTFIKVTIRSIVTNRTK